MKFKLFSSEKNKKKTLKVIVIIALVFLILFMIFAPFFNDVAKIREFINNFGIFGPLAFIFIHILQVLFAPIPGQVMGFVSGYLFGTTLGLIYTMIGVTIGSYIAFVLSRKYGRPFVEKVVDKKTLKKFDYLIEKGGVFTLFLIFLLPTIPDDAICFIAGLTKIRIRTLVLIAVIGRFPGFLVLNLLGNGVAVSNIRSPIIIFSLMMIISLGVFIYRERLEKLLKNFH